MTFEQFDQYQRERWAHRKEMSDRKGRAYAGTGDRFDNFNRIGKLARVDRKIVNLVYLFKHLDAIVSYVHDGEDGGEPVSGRIDDACVYLDMLDGMIFEESEVSGAEVPGDE